jgi:hypothetical protein
MGLFDLFNKGGGKKTEKGEAGKSSSAAKFAERAADKRAQTYDRQEAIQNLASLGTADAVAALLKRFTFIIDPSITDQEEKDAAFNGILRAGKEAIEPVRAFAAKAESLAWPMKILKELVSEEELIEELLVWLARWDTEYSKFIDPKIQLLVALEEHKHEKILEAVEAFLEDVNEPARFHAVKTTLSQDNPEVIPTLLRILREEESVRVRNKIVEGFAARGWTVPEEDRDATRKALPYGFSIDAQGVVKGRSDASV